MQRQSHLLTLPDNPFFCFPESVGNYWNHPQHYTFREAGSLNNFNIHYVESGKGYVEWDGETHTLEAGEAVLYFPLQRQHYYSSKDEPWNIRWVHFYGHGLQEYMVERGFRRSQLWVLRNRSAWEKAHEELLLEAEQHRMLHPSKLSSLTYAILAAFVEQAMPLAGNKSAASSRRIIELLPLMQQEASQPFILEHWADLAGVSPHYFCKLFRSEMEMTPVEFVTRCRLQTAKQWLLERKDANIGQIAMDAGYPSVSYFNKKFMKHEGMTPTLYRQLYGV